MLNSEIIFFKTSAQPIMVSRLVLAPIFFILLGFTHGQITDVCNVTNVGISILGEIKILSVRVFSHLHLSLCALQNILVPLSVRMEAYA